MNKKNLVILIIIGLTIRLTLAFLPGFKIDVNDFFAWATRLNEVGFTRFYSNQYFSDYTPGYMYILSFLDYLRNLLQINDKIFFLLLKFPAIIAEITLSILIYKELKSHVSSFYTLLGCSFILLNPALIFNSSVWGQIDGILALLLFLTIYYLKSKSLVLSSMLFGIALLVKPQAIAVLPIYILFLIRNLTAKKLLKLSLPFLVVVFTLSLPFFPNRPFTGLINLISNTANQYQYTSLFAYNFWGIIGFWLPDNKLWNGLSYQTIGYILFGVYWLMIVYFYFRKKISLYSLAVLATLAFFFLPTRVHERYLYPALVFLIILAASKKSFILFLLTAALSLIHFLNLYYVYVYYNEFYLKLPRLLYNPIIYNFLDGNGRPLSLVSTIIFILISVDIIRSYGFKEN